MADCITAYSMVGYRPLETTFAEHVCARNKTFAFFASPLKAGIQLCVPAECVALLRSNFLRFALNKLKKQNSMAAMGWPDIDIQAVLWYGYGYIRLRDVSKFYLIRKRYHKPSLVLQESKSLDSNSSY